MYRTCGIMTSNRFVLVYMQCTSTASNGEMILDIAPLKLLQFNFIKSHVVYCQNCISFQSPFSPSRSSLPNPSIF